MANIISFEGAHGSGKGALIEFLRKELEANHVGTFELVRDSEYPEFEKVKDDIRKGALSDKREIIATVAEIRAMIYSKYVNQRLAVLDLAILDRSYYTSAVWQSESFSEMYDILAENEKRGVPKSNLTFILWASPEVIMGRLASRRRFDLPDHNLASILRDQEKYLHLAKSREECIALETNREPADLARTVYSLISANNALWSDTSAGIHSKRKKEYFAGMNI